MNMGLDGYPDVSLEMVGLRFINGGIDNWDNLLRGVFRILVGTGCGYIQITEIETNLYCHSNSIPEDSAATTWPNLFFAAGGDFTEELRMAGFNEIPTSLEKRVREIGFQDVREDIKMVPVGVWPSGSGSPVAEAGANRY